MLDKLRDAVVPHQVMDTDERGFQTVRDTKVRSKRYVVVDKELLNNNPKMLADYLNSQVKIGNISGCDKVRNFISHLQNKRSTPTDFPVAKKGDDACISFVDTLLVFKDADPNEVRKYIRDDTKYTHTFSIKTAQFHTYNEIKSIENPEKVSFFGAGVKPRGSKYGKLYFRNEEYYDRKYFKGSDFSRTEDNQNPHFDMGLVALTWWLTEDQVMRAKIKLQHDLIAAPTKDWQYNFINIFGGKNCARYSSDFFKFIGFEGDFRDYFIYDEMDDRDMGIYHYMLEHYGWSLILLNPKDSLDRVSYLIFNDEYAKVFHDNTMWLSSISSSLYNMFNHSGDKQIHIFAYNGDTSRLDDQGYGCDDLNCQNDFGQTPLHIALFYGKFDFANQMLDGGADVDVQDYKGHSAIYYAAKMKSSMEKQLLLGKMAQMSEKINAVDKTGEHTALTAAVIAKDPEAVELLIESGANASFINSVGRNLMHLALENIHLLREKEYCEAIKVIKVLHVHDVNLIFAWSEEGQLPVVQIKKLEKASKVLHDIDKLYDPSLVLTEAQDYHEDVSLDFI